MKTIKFPSRPENVALVQNLMDEIRAENKLTDDQYDGMLLSLTEATTNAMKHGNKFDESKCVEIIYSMLEDGKTLSFIISDEGPGFNHRKVPDPLLPENLDKPSGRGVFLMISVADSINFSNKGATVELHFKI